MKQSIIDFLCYKGGKEFAGVTKITMPDIKFLTQNLSGAGIGGNIEEVMPLIDAMSMNIDFQSVEKAAYDLTGPGRHKVTFKAAQNSEDATKGTISAEEIKYVAVIIPKSLKQGTLGKASPANPSGEYAVRYWAVYIGGKLNTEIDPINYKCVIDGTDYLADVRKALGKK